MSNKINDDNPLLDLNEPESEKTKNMAGEMTTDFRMPGEGGAPAESAAGPAIDVAPGEPAAEIAQEAGPAFPSPDAGPGPGFAVGPDAGGMPVPSSPAPSKTESPLFTGWQVGLASMLATPFAGFILLAMNFFRRNQGADGWVMFLPGLIVFVGINVFPSFLPLELNIALILLLLPLFLFGMRQFDYDLFGAELVKQEEEERRGGGMMEIILVVVGMAVLAAGLQYLLWSQWNLGIVPWVQSLSAEAPPAQ
jgi:hypothetical protein